MKDLWLLFVAGAILSWGCYVPTLHEGQGSLGRTQAGKPNPKEGALRAFLCVGLAYFLTAVLVPGGLLWVAGMEETRFDPRGSLFATLAGALGAAGALCIILSIKSGGTPPLIASLVFAGAPIVNVCVSMLWHPPKSMPGGLFYVGIVMAAAGAGLVLYSKPT
jgi:hypothetical protein